MDRERRLAALAVIVGLITCGCHGNLSWHSSAPPPHHDDARGVDSPFEPPSTAQPPVVVEQHDDSRLNRHIARPSHPLALRLRFMDATHYRTTLATHFPEAELEDIVTWSDTKQGPLVHNAGEGLPMAITRALRHNAERLAPQLAPQLAQRHACASQDDEACASSVVDALGTRLMRRELREAQRRAFVTLYLTGADHREGIERLLEALLQAPSFIHLADLPEDRDARSGDLVALDGFSIAQRLAYFTTGAPPDAELMALASEGQLGDPDVRIDQVRRLARTPEAMAQVQRFYAEMAKLDVLPAFEPAGVDAATRIALEASFQIMIAEHANLETPHHIEALFSAPSREPDAAQRRGILTTQAFLTANPRQIQRGVEIREAFMCGEAPPPPPGVDTSLQEGVTEFEHANNPACKSCHAIFDPLGIPLNAFDSFGAYRDATPAEHRRSELQFSDIPGEVDGALELMARLGESELVAQCLAQRWTQFAIGQPYDAVSASAALDALDYYRDHDSTLVALWEGIVAQPSFAQRIWEEQP